MVGDEYRGLLEQLATMRSLCDKLKQNNLRRDLDQLQSSLHKYERATAGESDWPDSLTRHSFMKFSTIIDTNDCH